MGLFSPAWQGKNEKRALAFIEKERDIAVLREIAEKAPLPAVRLCALERIHDPASLLRLYRSEQDASVRAALEKRLHNMPALFGLAVDRFTSAETGRAALAHIDDEGILLRIVRETKHDTLRKDAAGKLHSEKAVLEAAKIEPTAAYRLTGAKNIAAALQATRNEAAADVLLPRLREPALLVALAQKAVLKKVRLGAAGRLTKAADAAEALRGAENGDIADVLLPKIDDQTLLLQIAGEAKQESIRRRAAACLIDERAVAQLIAAEPSVFSSLLVNVKAPETVAWLEQHTTDRAVLEMLSRKQGFYVCKSCGQKSPAASCICAHCGAENHDFKHVRDVHEYRDYATGFEYDECRRCGARANSRPVYDEYLE